jgi:hypothetical protein
MRKIASPSQFLSEIQGIAEYSQSGTPSREKLASLLVDLADRVRGITATEFPTEEALKKYLKEHPDADPKKHSVRKSLSHSERQTLTNDKRKKEKELESLQQEMHSKFDVSSVAALPKKHPLREKGMKLINDLSDLDKKLKG